MYNTATAKASSRTFCEKDLVLIARKHFYGDKKLCPCWRNPRQVMDSSINYTFEVEDLRNRELDMMYGIRLILNIDVSPEKILILSELV